MANPAFVFRDDLAQDKANQQELATQGMVPPPSPTNPSAPQPKGQANNAFGTLANTMGQNTAQAGYQAPKPDENPFDQFRAALDAQDPFKQKVTQSVTQSLDNPYAGADASNAAARDRLAREQNAAAEERRGQAVMAYGGNQTGQVNRDLNAFQNNRIMNEQAFELDAAANRENLGQQNRANAISQGLGVLGEDRQSAQALADLGQRQTEVAVNQSENVASRASAEKIAYANLSLQEKQLAQQAGQFASELEFKTWATQQGWTQDAITRAWQADQNAKQIASQEKLGFAGLSVEEKKLAQQATQFDNQLDFQKMALANGNTQAAIDRAWQAAQQEKQIASQEKISFAQLSFQEKQLLQQADQFDSKLDFDRFALEKGFEQNEIDRAWNASQNSEDRALQEKLANAQIGSAERLQASQQNWESAESEKNRTLESMMQNERISAQFSLAQMDQTFQEKLQNTGYLQTKDLQQMRQEFEKELTDKGIAADTAKQLADQQFRSMEAQNDRVFNATQNELTRTWETGERIEAQDWQTSITQLEMKQQDLMQERELLAQKDMQNTQLDSELKKVQLQIASQELMASAQLAQQDDQFMREYLLSKTKTLADIEMDKQRLSADLQTSLLQQTGIGLQNQAIEAGLKSQKVQDAISLATWGLEMGNGSQEAMAPFVAQIGTALETALKEQGVNLSSEDFAKMFAPAAGAVSDPETSPKNPGSVEAAQTARDYLNDIAGSLPANTDIGKVGGLLNNFALAKPGMGITGKIANRLSVLANGKTHYQNPSTQALPMGSTPKALTQEGADFFIMNQLIDSGLTVAQAYEAASRVVGKERMYNAINAVTGKNFNGTSL